VTRSELDHAVAKNIAVAGMAALLLAGQPQMALAKDAATSSQVQSTQLEHTSLAERQRYMNATWLC